ncbi:MAG: hypothetical protein WAL29_02505, partial [Bacteroidales bacterium]
QLIFRPNQLLRPIKTITGFVILNILFVSVTVAQTRGDLPPGILELVPSGTELSSQDFTASPTIAVANFTADKNVAIGRTVEYKLQFRVFDNSSPTWKMRESAYRKQMEDRIDNNRASLAPESANQGMFTADPVKETKNSWGSGLTQRLLNHPPNASEYVTYQCAYFGMIGGLVFELYVSGLPDSPGEGDKWAQKVAEVASRLTVSNIGNK